MITVLNLSTIAVEVPVDATDFKTHYSTHHTNDDVEKLVFSSDIQDPLKCGGDMIHLPPGQWEILGRPSSITEDQWKGIVQRIDGDLAWIPSYNDPDSGGHGYCYDDYETEDEHAVYYTSTESGMSLIKSKSLNPDSIILLKKISK